MISLLRMFSSFVRILSLFSVWHYGMQCVFSDFGVFFMLFCAKNCVGTAIFPLNFAHKTEYFPKQAYHNPWQISGSSFCSMLFIVFCAEI